MSSQVVLDPQGEAYFTKSGITLVWLIILKAKQARIAEQLSTPEVSSKTNNCKRSVVLIRSEIKLKKSLEVRQ